MWLLDTTSLVLREFQSTPPPYAILSHTWGEGEVSFQELGTLEAKEKAGYWKIERCCEQAKSDGFGYAWVDTCSIDKRSSAELSEAINSMFQWYSQAQVCYAYLADVSLLPGGDDDSVSSKRTISYPRPVWGFPSSRWFERGWTLQELIAPMHVVFFDRDWIEIGTKASLLEDLVEITGIPPEALMDPLSIRFSCVAERMSWAAKRRTTRVEDMAYSLLGIFGVNMPLLYGEGAKAFHRLQRQILAESNDHSIFAWAAPNPPKSLTELHGISVLAESPAMFSRDRAGPVTQKPLSSLFMSSIHPITITNVGLSMVLPIILVDGWCVAVLECLCKGDSIGIYVTGDPTTPRRSRLRQHRLVYLSSDKLQNVRPQSVYMSTDIHDVAPTPGHMQVVLTANINCKRHGWDMIYSCTWRRPHPQAVLKTYYHRRLWSLSVPQVLESGSSELHTLSVTDFTPVTEGEWLGISFTAVHGDAFSLVFGPKDGRLWCHGIVGLQLLQLERMGAPTAVQQMFLEDDGGVKAEPAWPYFRDRVSYALNASSEMHVVIKLVSGPPLPTYRIELTQEQIPDT
ncbi:hypothetical protein G647_06354 [Cladophialophora carrionii CBS 160.54]|uniref:Heterokaryon incompatibility domain-containing protein n=1 Tax=Cladophialophora carrionii CBS 160.54 TaxID=1279043 RepID=V9D6J0_9EURO|nr:uncharacterized protein G647_06354 [Cladophialophora carrionii CBS 160.54]ETI22281.1 hypothetical protein G647_06354 [Cladophialophora carrionii CBS 160.54]